MTTALQTVPFDNDFNGLEKREQDIARKLIDEIKLDPIRNSEIMKGDYRGLRKRRKGRLRILYAYCKDCRIRGDHLVRKCEGCDEIDNDTVIFFYIGLRGIIY